MIKTLELNTVMKQKWSNEYCNFVLLSYRMVAVAGTEQV